MGLAQVMLLDEISTGLDSASTFNIVKSLRNFAQYMNVRGGGGAHSACHAVLPMLAGTPVGTNAHARVARRHHYLGMPGRGSYSRCEPPSVTLGVQTEHPHRPTPPRCGVEEQTLTFFTIFTSQGYQW